MNMGLRHMTRLERDPDLVRRDGADRRRRDCAGASVTMGTAVVLVATCFVPPAIVLMLWRSDNASTMAETIRNAKAADDRLG